VSGDKAGMAVGAYLFGHQVLLGMNYCSSSQLELYTVLYMVYGHIGTGRVWLWNCPTRNHTVRFPSTNRYGMAVLMAYDYKNGIRKVDFNLNRDCSYCTIS